MKEKCNFSLKEFFVAKNFTSQIFISLNLFEYVTFEKIIIYDIIEAIRKQFTKIT